MGYSYINIDDYYNIILQNCSIIYERPHDGLSDFSPTCVNTSPNKRDLGVELGLSEVADETQCVWMTCGGVFWMMCEPKGGDGIGLPVQHCRATTNYTTRYVKDSR
jgi:hypothetical protein